MNVYLRGERVSYDVVARGQIFDCHIPLVRDGVGVKEEVTDERRQLGNPFARDRAGRKGFTVHPS